MDPSSAASLVSQVIQFVHVTITIVQESIIGYYSRSYLKLREDYGPFQAFILLFIFLGASNATEGVWNNLFRALDNDVMLIKKSLVDDCSMMAVAVRNSSQLMFKIV